MLELIERRTENGKVFDLGGRKRRLESHIGAIHYKDNYADPTEAWKDIDLTWVGNQILTAPYVLTLDGRKITVKDKKTGEISTIELLSVRPAGIPFEIAPENTRICFRHTLPSGKIPFEAQYRVTGDIPLRTRAWDDEGELGLETSLVDGILTEKLSVVRDRDTGQPRPAVGSIRIDPTLQVGAGSDDGFVRSGSLFYGADAWIAIGRTYSGSIDNSWHRFSGVSGLSGATIDVAYISLYGKLTDDGTPLTKIYAEDAEAPVAPTSGADYNSKPVTTAAVDWDDLNLSTTAFVNSPSIVSVIQELADSYNPSAIQILHKEDGAANNNCAYSHAYESDITKAAKLTIEYTEGGGGGAGHSFGVIIG